MIRYAAYIRTSHEDQSGNFSLDAQQREIREWVQAQADGSLVEIYIDESYSARTLDRPSFDKMRQDARHGKFDAVVVHRFDRLARNVEESLIIKTLFRQQYQIKVFSVTEPSEDSHGEVGRMTEGILETIAAWYSTNLAKETRKGKRERALQGYHNNRPPFGYDIQEGILSANEHEREGLQLAFEAYATGNYSDPEIAKLLNDNGFRSKSGKRFTTDTVRAILQNKTYLGFVAYREYIQKPDGGRQKTNAIEWFEGKHTAIIDSELFAICQEVRSTKSSQRNVYYPKHRIYLLKNLIYCADCVAEMPDGVDKKNYGKMRSEGEDTALFYRCRAKDYGIAYSHESAVASKIEKQVAHLLSHLELTAKQETHLIEAVKQTLIKQRLDTQIQEMRRIIRDVELPLNQGLIFDHGEYHQRRGELQQELAEVISPENNELHLARLVVWGFAKQWEHFRHNRQQQAQLIKLLVDKVWVSGNELVAITLTSDIHIKLRG